MCDVEENMTLGVFDRKAPIPRAAVAAAAAAAEAG